MFEKIFEGLKLNIISKNINIILTKCGQLIENESLLIIFDSSSEVLANLFYKEALSITDNVKIVEVETGNMHGDITISDKIEKQMKISDLVIGLTKFSLAHTKARYNASSEGVRYLSLPDYDIDFLKSSCIDVDYKTISKKVKKLTDILTDTKEVKIKTDLGTNLTLNIEGRIGNNASAIVNPGEIGSPPDIEANIAIVEDSTCGTFVVDGSIPCKEIGKVDEIYILEIVDGRIIKINGKESEKLNKIFDSQSELAKIPAELGFGFNDKASFSGYMLEDEGVYGSVHIGFGSNSTIGGKNNVPFHLDMVINKPDVWMDGIKVIEKGVHVF